VRGLTVRDSIFFSGLASQQKAGSSRRSLGERQILFQQLISYSCRLMRAWAGVENAAEPVPWPEPRVYRTQGDQHTEGANPAAWISKHNPAGRVYRIQTMKSSPLLPPLPRTSTPTYSLSTVPSIGSRAGERYDDCFMSLTSIICTPHIAQIPIRNRQRRAC
jgi:hypothetical protein